MFPTKHRLLFHTIVLKQTNFNNKEAKIYAKCVDSYLQNYVKHFQSTDQISGSGFLSIGSYFVSCRGKFK